MNEAVMSKHSQARAAALRATADRHRRAGKEWLASELERLAERTVWENVT